MAEIVMPIVFDPKHKSAEITYEQLAQTMEVGDVFGKLPHQCPVQPGQLIMDICESVKKFTGMDAVTRPIVIKEQYCNINREAIKQGRSPELKDYQIKRLVTKIEIPQIEFANTPDQLRPGIAITYVYSDGIKGMQLAFGENVDVCDNLCAFGKFHYTTYGNGKVSFEEGVQLMHHWLSNFGSIHKSHIQTIDMLKAVDISRERFRTIVGSLFEKAVLQNYGATRIEAPLNMTQVGALVQQSIPSIEKEDSEFTGWDLMNWGTHNLKPHTSDMVDIIQTTTKFNDFILDELDVPRPRFGTSL